MESDADRSEYISCESGRIWAGAYKSFHIWPWEFEQVRLTLFSIHNTVAMETGMCTIYIHTLAM